MVSNKIFRSLIPWIALASILGWATGLFAEEKPCPWNSRSAIGRTTALAEMAAKLTELSEEEKAYQKQCMAELAKGRSVKPMNPQSHLFNLGNCATNFTLTPAYNIVHGFDLLFQNRSEILLTLKNNVANMSVKSMIIGVLDIPSNIVNGIVNECSMGLLEGQDQYRCTSRERVVQKLCFCVANAGTLSLASSPKFLKAFAKLSMKANLSGKAHGLLGSIGELLSKTKPEELSQKLKAFIAPQLKNDPKTVEELISALAKSDSDEMKKIADLLQTAKDAEKATGASSEQVREAMSNFAKETYPVQAEINRSTLAAIQKGQDTFNIPGLTVAHAEDGRWLSKAGEATAHLPSDKLMGLPTGSNARTKELFETSLDQIANGTHPKGKTMTHANLDLNGVKTSNDMPTVPDYHDSRGKLVKGVAGGHEFGDSMFRAAGEAIREADELGFPLRLDGDEILENAARTVPKNATRDVADKILARKYEKINEAIRKKTLPLIEKQVKHIEDIISKLQAAKNQDALDKIDMGTIRVDKRTSFDELKKELIRRSYERHFIIRHDVPSLSAAVAVIDDGLVREAQAVGRTAKEHLKIYTDQVMAIAKAEYKAANGTDRGVITANIWEDRENLKLNMKAFTKEWIPPRIPVIRFRRQS